MTQPISFRAAPGKPCPVCGATSKGCSATADALHFCRGEPRPGWRRLTCQPDDAGFHHYRADDEAGSGRGGRSGGGSDRRPDWAAAAQRYADLLNDDRRRKLAKALRLPVEALDLLPLLGCNPDNPSGPCWTFPEVDAAGVVVGINRRYLDGKKRVMPGGNRGLTVVPGWLDRPGPLFSVEGATDTLAMCHAGLAAVGRPSNSGGAELLAELFRGMPAERQIIIVGENDEKPNGDWPGRDGAIAVARRLAASLARPVHWALPPAGGKGEQS